MEALTVGSPPIRIALRRRANARRLTLRITRDGPVMTLPNRMPLREAEAFARDKEGWIRDRLETQLDIVIAGLGAEIPIEGHPHLIVQGTGRGCRLGTGVLEVGGKPDTAPSRIGAFLKVLARDRLVDSIEYYAHEVKREIGRISLRDTRSRWGSCTTQGDLMFSWRLVLAPPEVLDYVAAHEVAHRVEMNHSAAFWAEVERICPSYKTHRKWLRDHGAGLHRFRFAKG